MHVILEGILTTLNDDGSPHLAPMGPRVEDQMRRLVLRPFRSSGTYRNLSETGQGIFHVTDDVEMIARAAVHRLSEIPPFKAATAVQGVILSDACRWYAFRVSKRTETEPRASFECNVVDQGRLRDFCGFNRAKHAVLEAAILATRIQILPAAEIYNELSRLRVVVDKTAGKQERQAFAFLEHYVRELAPQTT